jgi:glucose/arabinose dehydrogenase
VGQNSREEIDFEPVGQGGRNYGWDFLEGNAPFEGEAPPDAVPPILDYGRDKGATVVGGFVYRGSRIPGLAGAYLYVDFYQTELRALRQQGGRTVEEGVLPVEAPQVASFGEDHDGELYLLSASDGLLRLDPA